MAATLPKDVRLCGRAAIAELFSVGARYTAAPLRVVWTRVEVPDGAAYRFGIGVPKRLFKRAVRRNLLKRRTREAFRLNQQLLAPAIDQGSQIRMMFTYISTHQADYGTIEQSVREILEHIAHATA